MEELKDIKPPLELPLEVNIVYWASWFLGLIVLLIVSYFIWKIYVNKFKKPKEVNFLEKLQNLDMTNSKQFAYDVTKYGPMILNTDEKKELFEELKLDLEKYKYKKEVESLDKTTKDIFHRFLIL